MIAVVDYGMGNLRSVLNAFESLGVQAIATNDPAKLEQAAAIIVPGVGAFRDGMHCLTERGLVAPLNEQVLGVRKPFLGICLGMQFLGSRSQEGGEHPGLGWIPGQVRRIVPEDKTAFKVPHMGWNDVRVHRRGVLLQGLPEQPIFYFVHSYYLEVDPAAADAVTASCWHGADITASLERDNIFGVQFHPEKSQQHGLDLLRNFLAYVRERARVTAC